METRTLTKRFGVTLRKGYRSVLADQLTLKMRKRLGEIHAAEKRGDEAKRKSKLSPRDL